MFPSVDCEKGWLATSTETPGGQARFPYLTLGDAHQAAPLREIEL